jgi:hypothetical protein
MPEDYDLLNQHITKANEHVTALNDMAKQFGNNVPKIYNAFFNGPDLYIHSAAQVRPLLQLVQQTWDALLELGPDIEKFSKSRTDAISALDAADTVLQNWET